jgi:hypothetical protein
MLCFSETDVITWQDDAGDQEKAIGKMDDPVTPDGA